MWQGEYRKALKVLYGKAEEPHTNLFDSRIFHEYNKTK